MDVIVRYYPMTLRTAQFPGLVNAMIRIADLPPERIEFYLKSHPNPNPNPNLNLNPHLPVKRTIFML